MLQTLCMTPKIASSFPVDANFTSSTAGSETTATALSCITYYLLKTPHACTKLQNEVRSAFTKYEDINSQAANRLQYMRAVCLEGMRMYAPLPFALPRVVPEGGDTVDGIQLPAGVSFSRCHVLGQ
jgi:cytochrome P450